MTVQLQARNATPKDLVEILQNQQAHKLDLVTPSRHVWSRDGKILIHGVAPQIVDDGVTTVDGTYKATEVFDDGISDKLVIPRQYVRKTHETRPDIYDANVNGWLHGHRDRDGNETATADDRSFLLRLFRRDEGGEGVARALLSNKYALSMDNIDMLLAVQRGIKAAGVKTITRVTNLSERGMRIRFEAQDIYAEAPGLLENYRDPFGGSRRRRAGSFDELRQQYGMHHIFSNKDRPLATIGFDFSNSETGDGKYRLTPFMEMIRCTNGWVERKDGIAHPHLGSRLAEGVVRPSHETIVKAGELVSSETKDAVTQWLTQGYLESLIARHTEQAQVEIDSPTETVPAVVLGLGFSPDEAAGVLDMFIAGGQMTAGGIAQAVSAFAQTVEDVDRAFELELKTVDALEAASQR